MNTPGRSNRDTISILLALCAIAYFAYMDASATVYNNYNYKCPFDINHNGNVACNEIGFDTPGVNSEISHVLLTPIVAIMGISGVRFILNQRNPEHYWMGHWTCQI